MVTVFRSLRVMLPAACLLALGLCLVPARCEQGTAAADPKTAPAAKEPPAPSVKVALVFDKPSYFLGENILGHFGVTNTGTTPVKIDMGGDDRGGIRPLRFKVSATGKNDQPVADPYGPLGYSRLKSETITIDAGKTVWRSFPLMRYCAFIQAGSYTVRVYHDLGWDHSDNPADSALPAGEHKAPIAEGTLTLAMPTAEQAQDVLAQMQQLPDGIMRQEDGRNKPYADFTTLGYPVYLPLLKKAAENGDPRACVGLGALPSPDAISALLDLLNHPKPEVASAARRFLLPRIPDPQNAGLPWVRYQCRLLAGAWSETLKPEVMAAVWKMLDAPDRPSILAGAHIVACLGSKEVAPRLCQVVDRVLDAVKDDPAELHDLSTGGSAGYALTRALEALYRRGAPAPAAPKTPAQSLLYMINLNQQAKRPAGWQKTVVTLLNHPLPYLRAVVLQRLPQPLDPACITPVGALLQDHVLLVQQTACVVAKMNKRPEFANPAMAAFKTATDPTILSNLESIALDDGVTRDKMMDACIDRFDQAPVCTPLFYQAADLLQVDGNFTRFADINPARVAELQPKWRAFVAANRDAIRTGHTFRIGAELTQEMFPPGTGLYPPKEKPAK